MSSGFSTSFSYMTLCSTTDSSSLAEGLGRKGLGGAFFGPFLRILSRNHTLDLREASVDGGCTLCAQTARKGTHSLFRAVAFQDFGHKVVFAHKAFEESSHKSS